MEPGSGSESLAKAERGRGPRGGATIGSVEPRISAFVPRRDHSPRELKSWAKRTGFVSTFSGETAASGSERNDSAGFGLDRGVDRRRGGGSSPKIEIDPVLGRTKPSKGVEIEPDAGAGHGGVRSEGDEAVRAEGKRRIGNVPVLGASDGETRDENEIENEKEGGLLEEWGGEEKQLGHRSELPSNSPKDAIGASGFRKQTEDQVKRRRSTSARLKGGNFVNKSKSSI